MTTAHRLAALLDHLGVTRAHFATQMPGDVAGLVAAQPERVAGLVLAVPVRLDANGFRGVASRMMIVTGDKGLSAQTVARARDQLAGTQVVTLADYEAGGWADVAADRPSEVANAITAFLSTRRADRPAKRIAAAGRHEGLSYRISGDGPALVLMPFFLAASQWDPIVARLSETFTVIQVGGPHVGGIAALEDRAAAPTYLAMFNAVADCLAIKAGERILDVGCGSGALDRHLARRLGPSATIDAVDINAYMLREAHELAASDGVAGQIRFGKGSAVELPFADATFDVAYSVTVLEECDADKAIAEIMRVTKPGGRIGIVVRAIDLPQWWHLDLPPALAAKVNVPPQSIGPGGVADKSLYTRMADAGLTDLVTFPQLVTLDRPQGPTWRYREDHVLSLLTAEEAVLWHAATAAAAKRGLLFQASPVHCAIGRKPVAT